MKQYDFGGWATRNNVRCADGRVIKPNAFAHCDGKRVSLIWNHNHNDMKDIIGYADLENRPEGVYAYGSFNNTELGARAKALVQHGDLTALSIYANQLKESAKGEVFHGTIRELSVVVAPANPEAYIDALDLTHGIGTDGDYEAEMGWGDEIELYHADEPNTQEENEEKEMSENKERTVQDVIDTMNEEQKKVLYGLVGMAAEKSNDKEEGEDEMKHNVFYNDTEENVIQHSMEDIQAAINDGKKFGSMKESFLQHGIEDIEYLFPEAHNQNNPPEFINNDTDWVKKVLSKVHHTPFSRIKSMFADITEDDARAKGYLAKYSRDDKGNKVSDNEAGEFYGKPAYKKEEVFGLLKRVTTPTTIYKKQKLDRDDIVDITDFDVLSWLKAEMRGKLDEELARAILIGDGRSSASDDKINEGNIRPAFSDANLFTVKAKVTMPTAADEDDEVEAVVKLAVKSRKYYRGTGKPDFYTTEDFVTNALLLQDGIGHRLYKDEADLAKAMRVNEIITVPPMENMVDENGDKVVGLIVNLADYNVGADKGGAVNMFDDFDIDYNAQKYLIETRCSGAMVKPYSAVAMTMKTDAEATVPAFSFSGFAKDIQ